MSFYNRHPTWQEVERYASFAISSQVQTMVAVQCDAGFRPSAFIGLNYGDISWSHGLPVASVRDGKNGSYEVTLFRSIEYIRRWLQCHPTKNPNDPLWISEACLLRTNGPINPKRYSYVAVSKQFKLVAKKAGYEGDFDLYAMRHLSCANDKRSGIPAELAAARHNHSIKHFLKTYGHLESEDDVKRMVLHLEHAQRHRMQNSFGQGNMDASPQQPQFQQPMQSQQVFAQQYPPQPMMQEVHGVGMQQPMQMQQAQPVQQPMQPMQPMQPQSFAVPELEKIRQKQEQHRIREMATAHLRH